MPPSPHKKKIVQMDGGAVLWASNRRVSDLIPSKSPRDRLRRQQLFEDLMSSWSVHGILENDGNFVRIKRKFVTLASLTNEQGIFNLINASRGFLATASHLSLSLSSLHVPDALSPCSEQAVYAKDGTSDETECLWASIKCPEQQPWQDLAGTVRAVKNSARLTVKAAQASIGESFGVGGGFYGGGSNGRRRGSKDRFWLARPLEAVRKWFARRRR